MKRLSRWFLLTLTIIALSGCTVLQRGEEHQRTYQLVLPTLEAEQTDQRQGSLSVSRLEVQPGYDTSAIAYRRDAFELEYFVRSRWTDRPARMIHPAIIDGLQALGPFRHTIDATAGIPTRFRMDVELVRLEQDFQQDPSMVRLDLRVRLLDRRGRDIVLSETIRVRETAPSEDAVGGIIAANRALEKAVRELSDRLYEVTASMKLEDDDDDQSERRSRSAEIQRRTP